MGNMCGFCKININRKNFQNSKNMFCNTDCKAEWQKENLKGTNNTFFGKKHTEKTKEQISKSKNPKYPGFRAGREYLRTRDGRYVHRVIMEEYLGRCLLTEEHIHHRNGDKMNNNIKNLELVNNSIHRKEHVQLQQRDCMGRFE